MAAVPLSVLFVVKLPDVSRLFLLLLFPNGRLPSRRWRALAQPTWWP